MKAYHDFTWESALASSLRAQWQLDDVLRPDQDLDFTRNFLPESLARTAALTSLSPDEQRTLNQISGNQYLYLFGLVEEFILPFLMDHARPTLRQGHFRARALLNFATEEAKHIQLFKRFHRAFARGFPVQCLVVGPPGRLSEKVLNHDPLAVGLIILMTEWMTQGHYLGTIRGQSDIDPLFESLLRHHWMEEAQHAKLDTLIVDALAQGRSEDQIDKTIDEFFQIVSYLDACLKAQASLNIDALEKAIGRTLPDRAAIINQQHQAARWTYFGSAMVHDRFRATLNAISPKAADRVARVAASIARLSGEQTPGTLPGKPAPKRPTPALA